MVCELIVFDCDLVQFLWSNHQGNENLIFYEHLDMIMENNWQVIIVIFNL